MERPSISGRAKGYSFKGQVMLHPNISDYSNLTAHAVGTTRAPAPVVSVVTVCRNAAACIERCLQSVRMQNFHNYEHIIVDAASTDATAGIALRTLRAHDLLLSEPDRGISDAMNKGVALARGRYIQFVHADDWLSPSQLQTAVQAIEETSASYVFGDLVFFVAGKPEFIYRGDPDYTRSIDARMPALNHPTMLIRREAFEAIGLFSLEYKCAMDYEWLLRLHRSGRQGEYRPEILGCMNHDGISNREYWRTMREVREVAIGYGRSPIRANLEFLYRVQKISLGRILHVMAAPVQRRIRQRINRSYRLPSHEILDRIRS